MGIYRFILVAVFFLKKMFYKCKTDKNVAIIHIQTKITHNLNNTV